MARTKTTSTQPPTGPSSGEIAPATTATVRDFSLTLGSTGTRRSGDYIQHDFIPSLNGVKGAQAFFEMGENHPLLGGILFALEMLLRRVAWKVEPPDDMEDEPKAQEAAGLVRRMLFSELDRPWPDVMSDVATMFQFGYAPLEIVYRLDETTGQVSLKGLYLRSQTSVTRWDFEPATGAMRGMWQQDVARTDTREVYLPRTKLAHFRTTPRGDNPEGRSLLRRAYTTYKRNLVIEEAEGRAALRAAGFVLCTVPGQILRRDASNEDKARLAAIRAVVENVAADRQGAVILPGDVDQETKQPLYNLSYVVADGQRSADMSPLIERGDARMAGSVLADFMLLGQGATGSFALSSDKTALFIESLQGFVDSIAEEINRAVIAPLWRLRGEDPALRPKVSGGEIGPQDVAGLAAFATQLVGAGVLTADDQLEAHLRKAVKLPKHDKSTARQSPQSAAAAGQAAMLTETNARANGKANARGNRSAKGKESNAKRGAMTGADAAEGARTDTGSRE